MTVPWGAGFWKGDAGRAMGTEKIRVTSVAKASLYCQEARAHGGCAGP